MIKNYFKIALRNISRNLSYTFLNIFGLTLGVASCLTIFLIVRNELNYDNSSSKANRTYRVTLNALDFNSNISLAVLPALRNDFPELEHSTQVFYQPDATMQVGQNRFREINLVLGDNQLTQVFEYKWLAGDEKTALSQPNSVVLTSTIAKKYFGNTDPMGQVIKFGDQATKVTGVIQDPPTNTSLPLNLIISMNTFFKQPSTEFWNISGGSYAYVVIPEHYSIKQLQSRMPAFIKKNWGADIAKDARLLMQPLRDVHFDQRYINNIVTPTSKDTYYALIGVALLIIITACINFINLATARAIKRAKEVGVRKVLGANRGQLIGQFMGEITILVLTSVILGVAVCALFLAKAGTWMNITISAGQLLQPEVLGWIAAITVSVILFAGLYPAFVQSGFQPADSFKNKVSASKGGLSLRKALVVAQFSISQIMIVGTLIVAHQMDFFENQDLGFNKDAVISVRMPVKEKREVFEQHLATMPGVKSYCVSSGSPSYNNSWAPFSAPALGFPKDNVTELKFIDEKYTDMFGMTMLAGQKITRKAPTDSTNKVVVNETLMHDLGVQDPQKFIGQLINVSGQQATVIGVVKDFQSESKHKKIRACVLQYNVDRFRSASIQLQPENMPATIAAIGKQWSQLFPDDVFKYEFIDEHIAAMYKQEQKVFTAFQLFSYIAILIGCLGLYGLISFAASQRTKEVGIRKILGASVQSIIGLFTREFVLLIAVAFLIAAPLGYYMMHKWLQNFAYHITIGPAIFFIAIASSLVIAALTTAHQAVKAALANPVKSLRSE
ncbi:ABC transporter permease [Mucilaginibacter sp. UR6-11]|uniref:ABC transporter permease n=1 Tax=Mucilaginibacter sp. UR6-11 TaxID=1435644 RepID=UPI001E484661|nr:ABC transporter permease [Mucilaginibacter sp. UR6-11]MCC8424895.1 ABC transporter permease [Mucilaginibacter sp. UR6-11]